MNNFWHTLKKPILALAPMAGVTDTPFRQMCKEFGADVIYTEFASVNALIHGNQATRDMITFAPQEQPVVCQLFGRDPELFSQSAKILEELGFAGVDINFGCPAYKVVKAGGGVKLMRNLNLCQEIVHATCVGTKLPVSVKLRASIRREISTLDRVEGGTDEADGSECQLDQVTALNLVNKIKRLPVTAIMLHARSYERPFDGEPDLEMVHAVRDAWPGVLIANGGIYSPEKAKAVLDETGADGVGIARGAWGRPWIFRQIKDYLATGSHRELSWEETRQIILRHAALTLTERGNYGLIELRKHLAWYVKSSPGASELRARLMQVNSLADIRAAIARTA